MKINQLLEETKMNTKFNIGSIEIKVPAGEDNPEINMSLKEMSYEVTDLSLTEYGSVLKSVLSEGRSLYKEILQYQDDIKCKDFARQEHMHKLKMKENAAVAERVNGFNVTKVKEDHLV
jgi:hypothetical protein